MPVGPYPDMDACIADNQDMDDPGAFCAWLEKESSAKDKQAAFEKAAQDKGLARKNGQWVREYQNQMKMRTVLGVEIFAVGEHNGDVYLPEDLNIMVEAFKALKGRVDPPVKVGHTSDAFNKRLARELGVPEEMISGEAGSGEGAMALGWISNLYVDGNILVGDFSDVPEPIADLIESKGYNQVSAEILYDFIDGDVTYRRVLTAVALLGAQLPAVRETAPLEVAGVFTYAKKPTKIYTFEIVNQKIEYDEIEPTLLAAQEAMEGAIKGKAGAVLIRGLLKDIKTKVRSMLKTKGHSLKTNTEEVVMKELLEALGLKEEATEEEAVAALKAITDQAKENTVDLKPLAVALKLEEDAGVEALVTAITAQLAAKAEGQTAEAKEFSDLKTANMTLTTKVKKLEHSGRITHFTAMAEKWGNVTGTPAEIAEKLVRLEEKNEEAAADLVKTYNETNDQLEAAGIKTNKGTPARGEGEEEHEFVKEQKAYAADKHVDMETAFVELKKSRPDLFKEYMKQRPIVFTESPTDKRRVEAD